MFIYLRCLTYPKFKLTPDERHDLLADYLPWTQVVRIPNPPSRTPPCRDPHDVKFLQLAFAADADALVTGDADLLILAPRTRVAIVTPAEAVKTLSA